jgi:hypothetical protein
VSSAIAARVSAFGTLISKGTALSAATRTMRRLIESFGFRLHRQAAAHLPFARIRNCRARSSNLETCSGRSRTAPGAPTCRICDHVRLFGDTPVEPLAEIELPIEAWLAVAREDGLPIPEPRYRAPTRAAG